MWNRKKKRKNERIAYYWTLAIKVKPTKYKGKAQKDNKHRKFHTEILCHNFSTLGHHTQTPLLDHALRETIEGGDTETLRGKMVFKEPFFIFSARSSAQICRK
jgi:hypothetical protein